MSYLVSFTSPRVAEIAEADRQPIAADQVRLRTLFSGITAETELTAYRGSNPYLTKRWDAATRLFGGEGSSVDYPVNGWGYDEVGEVVELGADAVSMSIGDRVWGVWGQGFRRAAAAGVVLPTAMVHMDHFTGDFDPARRPDGLGDHAATEDGLSRPPAEGLLDLARLQSRPVSP